MSGASIIGALLRADGEPSRPVDAASIKEGRLPPKVALPVLLVRTVSSVDRQTLKRGALVRETDRIAVTVRAESLREVKALIRWVRARCAGKTGDIGGGTRVSVLTAGLGPDVNGPGDAFENTQDFRVSHDAPA